MRSTLDFAYAQARIQARYAALPPESEWRRLAGARSLGAYLEDARVGPLRPWVKGFSALSGAHDVERGLRSFAWEEVNEVASWVPRAWRPAVQWIAWLPFLAVFEQLARARQIPSWTTQDERLRTLLEEDGAPSPLALRRQGLAELAVPGDAEQVASRWMREWRHRWPAARLGQGPRLDAFCREVGDHLAAFRLASPDAAWDLRRQLRDRLRLRLHQRLLQPLTVFLYVALILLDLERLRGELLRRCVFSPGSQEAGQGEAV
jgi:hypothetical protein